MKRSVSYQEPTATDWRKSWQYVRVLYLKFLDGMLLLSIKFFLSSSQLVTKGLINRLGVNYKKVQLLLLLNYLYYYYYYMDSLDQCNILYYDYFQVILLLLLLPL